MGWRISTILVNESGKAPLSSPCSILPEKEQRVLKKLGLSQSIHLRNSNLVDDCLPPEGHIAIGAYENAVIWCDQFGFGHWVGNDSRMNHNGIYEHFFYRLSKLFPVSELLAVELNSYNNYAAFSLYKDRKSIRIFQVDCDNVYINEGVIQPEEKDILSSSNHLQDIGEELAFAMMSRILGVPFDEYPLEELPINVYKKKNIWYKLFGHEYLLK